jgi:hypothetical protein
VGGGVHLKAARGVLGEAHLVSGGAPREVHWVGLCGERLVRPLRHPRLRPVKAHRAGVHIEAVEHCTERRVGKNKGGAFRTVVQLTKTSYSPCMPYTENLTSDRRQVNSKMFRSSASISFIEKYAVFLLIEHLHCLYIICINLILLIDFL